METPVFKPVARVGPALRVGSAARAGPAALRFDDQSSASIHATWRHYGLTIGISTGVATGVPRKPKNFMYFS